MGIIRGQLPKHPASAAFRGARPSGERTTPETGLFSGDFEGRTSRWAVKVGARLRNRAGVGLWELRIRRTARDLLTILPARRSRDDAWLCTGISAIFGPSGT